MADQDDRTEAASARRLERARAMGQAPLSREVAGLAVLASATLILIAVVPAWMPVVAQDLETLAAGSNRLSLPQAVAIAARATLIGAAPFVIAAVVAGSAAVLLQTGFLFNATALMPDLSRLDPRRGLRRIAGPTTLLETAKAVVKLVIVGGIGWHFLSGLAPGLGIAMLWQPTELLRVLRQEAVTLLASMLGAQAVLAGLDVLRARFQHGRSLRMSRQDLRDEHKESEGDPQIKARIRLLRRQRARQRMLAAIPTATVVVTNPTHYAVALVYKSGTGDAPRVVAKGVDTLAARIRDMARAHAIPVVANPPLARALHRVELDAQIPAEHFKAVAELIAYVWRLRARSPTAP